MFDYPLERYGIARFRCRSRLGSAAARHATGSVGSALLGAAPRWLQCLERVVGPHETRAPHRPPRGG